MRLSLLLIFTLYSNLANALVCDKDYEPSSLKKAIDKCQLKKAAKEVGEALNSVDSDMAFEDFCQINLRSNPDKKKRFCDNPAQNACKFKGKLLDSNCYHNAVSGEVIMQESEHIRLYCKEEEQKKMVLTLKEKKECFSQKLSIEQCQRLIKIRRPIPKSTELAEKIFTKEKRDKIFNLSEKIRDEVLSLIEKNDSLKPKQKQVLIKNIKRTIVRLDKSRFENPELRDCYFPTKGKLKSTAFSRLSGNGQYEIHLCSGLVQNMEHMNPHVLIHLLAHEFAHSIDPCALENLSKSTSYKKYYPKLVNCLRGNKKGGCKDALVSCNKPNAVEGYCKDKYPDDWKNCKEYFKRSPTCAIGKGGEEVEQINEAFSDHLAGSVLASMMKDSSDNERGDALIGLTSGFSRRDYGCKKDKSNNAHSTAYIRMSHILFSNEEAKKALGCEETEAKKCIGF